MSPATSRPSGPDPGTAFQPVHGDPLLAALRQAGSAIRRVRYRENRSVLLSVSRDGETLNSHACFRGATPAITGAVARFITSRRGSAESRLALSELRAWEGTLRGLEGARRERPRRSRRRTDGPETRELRQLFQAFNRDHFAGRLPEVPLRISARMRRALGTITYEPGADRRVREIAISADLLLPANRAALEDTLLHEMAHAEAWLLRGHRGHGAVWRRIAERVGCTPRALTRTPIHRTDGHGAAARSLE